MEGIFRDEKPLHERFGFGKIDIGRMIVIYDHELDDDRQNTKGLEMLRRSVNSYARYYDKRMKTSIQGGALYIKRIK